jgi:tRNA(fMet)-specific endonuclease VapC
MLDTDTCAYAIKAHPRVRQHLDSHRLGELAISVVTEAELRFGAVKSGRASDWTLVAGLLERIQILDFTSHEAEFYARVRAELELAGRPIGPQDTFIAAHALAQNLVLVTNNVREFRRVPGLKVENWAA